MKVIYISFFDPISKYEIEVLKKYSEYCDVILLPLRNVGGRNIVGSDIDRLNIIEAVLNEYKLHFLVDKFDFSNKDDSFGSILTYIGEKYGFDNGKILLMGINNIAFKPLLGAYQFHQGVFNVFKHDSFAFEMVTPIIKLSDFVSSNVSIDCFGTINIPKSAYDYIIDKKIYFVDKLYKMEDLERFEHSVSVANICYKIALLNRLDYDKAFIAGLLHDCGKDIGNDISSELMHRYFLDDCELLPFAYHQFVGSFLAKKEFGINDEDMLNAIKFHCTGRSDMSELEKVVYSSDKTDPLRGYDSSLLIEKCCKNIDNGFVAVLADNYSYLKKNMSDCSNKYTSSCFKYYLGVNH